MVANLIALLVPKAIDIIGQVVTDKAQLAKIEADLRLMIAGQNFEVQKLASEIVLAETAGTKIQRMVRPVGLLLIYFLLIWLVAIAPLLGVQEATIAAMERVPTYVWVLMMVGWGGYTASRGVEKVTDIIMRG